MRYCLNRNPHRRPVSKDAAGERKDGIERKYISVPQMIEEDTMTDKQTATFQKEELKQKFVDKLQLECSVSPDEASDKQIYQVLSAMMVEKLAKVINTKNSVPHRRPPVILANTLGRVIKISLGPASGLTP